MSNKNVTEYNNVNIYLNNNLWLMFSDYPFLDVINNNNTVLQLSICDV